MKVAKAKGRIRGQQVKLNRRQEAHPTPLRDADGSQPPPGWERRQGFRFRDDRI